MGHDKKVISNPNVWIETDNSDLGFTIFCSKYNKDELNDDLIDKILGHYGVVMFSYPFDCDDDEKIKRYELFKSICDKHLLKSNLHYRSITFVLDNKTAKFLKELQEANFKWILFTAREPECVYSFAYKVLFDEAILCAIDKYKHITIEMGLIKANAFVNNQQITLTFNNTLRG